MTETIFEDTVVRESSRDSGVDVNTPSISNKEEETPKFNFDNKSQIPKYKFNQKKYNLRKHIQKVCISIDSGIYGYPPLSPNSTENCHK